MGAIFAVFVTGIQSGLVGPNDPVAIPLALGFVFLLLVVIPGEVAYKVADQVDRVRESEGKMIEWLNSPDFSVEALRKRYGL